MDNPNMSSGAGIVAVSAIGALLGGVPGALIGALIGSAIQEIIKCYKCNRTHEESDLALTEQGEWICDYCEESYD